MQKILEQSSKTLSELEKVKKDVRSVKAEKINVKRAGSCSDNDEFRRRAVGPIQFVEENMSKMRSMLQGDRDSCPADLGKNDESQDFD